MAKFVQIYHDGCNGFQRGDLVNAVPAHFEETGTGVWRDPDEDESNLYIEILDGPGRDLTEDEMEREEEEP